MRARLTREYPTLINCEYFRRQVSHVRRIQRVPGRFSPQALLPLVNRLGVYRANLILRALSKSSIDTIFLLVRAIPTRLRSIDVNSKLRFYPRAYSFPFNFRLSFALPRNQK